MIWIAAKMKTPDRACWAGAFEWHKRLAISDWCVFLKMLHIDGAALGGAVALNVALRRRQ
jgi:hypothetical protein